jgi:hypothetical protein
MSELKRSFKKAIATFTHASDFIVPLYEDAYVLAEDISDEIAAERNLYQEEDYEAQQVVEDEIEGAVAFFGKLAVSFLVIQISLLEDCLREISEAAAQAKNLPFSVDETERFTTARAKQFLERELGIQFPNPWPAWEKVQEFERLRDQMIRQGSLDLDAVISDTLLVDVNETIVLFFEELQSYLLQNSEAG